MACLALVFAGCFSALAQQSGIVSGVVVSTWDGTPLPGVTVTVRGTTLATQTDANGRYQLENVPPGDQVFRFSKSGYASAVVTDVRVLLGQTSTVNGNLRPEFYEMEEYEVTAEEFTEQTEQIMIERQESSVLMESIGSDTFSRLSLDDAGSALAKTSGASVVDGKFAVIRGLADRYTSTTLNGADIPSADPDRRAAQLDLFPAHFIRRIDVSKTFTPDQGGGFAGGAIDIVTRDFPDDFLFSLSIGASYNTQASLRDDFPVTDHSSTDWLAMDDGKRKLPGIAANSNPAGTTTPLDPAIKNSFNSSQFAPIEGDSPLNSSFSLAFGDTQKLFGRRLGFAAGLTYKNDYNLYEGQVTKHQPRFDQEFPKDDLRGIIEYSWGSLVTLAYEVSENHELGFNFLFTQAAEDEARRLRGQDETLSTVPGESYAEQNILHWTERNLTYYQLKGKHEFPELNEIELDWVGALSSTTQDEPDYRIFQFFAQPGDPNDPTDDFYGPDGPADPSRPTRFWREIEENNKFVRADVTIPLPSYNSKENSLKLGPAWSMSERDYRGRAFDIRIAGNSSFLQEGDPNNLDDRHDYFNFPGGNITYRGEQTITAAYLMADWGALEWLRLVGGARYEKTSLSLNGRNLTLNRPLEPGDIQQDDLLPSLTGAISLRDNLLLRASWSQTVVRPIYREIAPAPIYDVALGRTYIGNPNLTLSSSDNYDLRLEWFPNPGELVALSFFMKKIEAPIELSSVRDDNSLITFENFEEAEVRGIEFEYRQNLGNLWKPLENLTLGFNAAYIQSEVPIPDNQLIIRRARYGEDDPTRPLYDQPEYVINADLTYEIRPWGTTLTLAGGAVGRRLVLVGLGRPDEYEEPAPQLDFFIAQKIGKHFKAKLSAKNLLDPAYEVTQNWPGFGSRTTETYTKGMTFGLSVTYDF